MKRKIFFLFIITLFCACNQQITNDWVADELIGDVKHILTTTGEAMQTDDTIRFGRYTYTEEVFYDKKGLKTNAQTLNDDGSINLRCIYQHDKQGHITIADMRDANDMPIMRNVFEYDDNGFLIKTISIDPDEHVDMTIIYENDSAGNQIKQTVYDHLGRLVYSEAPSSPNDSTQDVSYEYDRVGNWTRKTTYHLDSIGNRYPTFIWIRNIEYYR